MPGENQKGEITNRNLALTLYFFDCSRLFRLARGNQRSPPIFGVAALVFVVGQGKVTSQRKDHPEHRIRAGPGYGSQGVPSVRTGILGIRVPTYSRGRGGSSGGVSHGDGKRVHRSFVGADIAAPDSIPTDARINR